MLVGTLTVIIWKQLEGGVFDLYELLPGFIFAWLAIIIGSKLGKPASKENQEKFKEIQQIL